MPNVPVNYAAVVVAALVLMVIGALWYSPWLFGERWQAAMQWNREEREQCRRGAGKALAWTSLAALATAFVLEHLIVFLEARSWVDGAEVGCWMWLGFVVTTASGSVLFERRSFDAYMLNCGYHLIGLAGAGAVLAKWPR